MLTSIRKKNIGNPAIFWCAEFSIVILLISIAFSAPAQFNRRPDQENDSLRFRTAQSLHGQHGIFSAAGAHKITDQSSALSKVIPDPPGMIAPHQPLQSYMISAFTTGLWSPQGRNKVLGTHPVMGFMYGGWVGNWLVEANIEFRFGDAAGDYAVNYYNQIITTRGYFGGFIGIHAGYAFLNFKSSTVYALAGVGLDGFDSYYSNDDQDGVSINTLAKNIGVGYQHFTRKGGMFGVEFTGNFINYQNPGGTPLDGNAFSIRLLIGRVQ